MEPIEYLDIVDENDVVIGRDSRELVHAAYAIHRGVHVFVLNPRGAVLLQRRSDSVDYYPGRWDASAGGQVRSGETYAEAGTRELAEELGLEIEPGDLILVAKYDSYSERQREKRALFVCYSEGPFTADLQSIAELEFALAPEIDAMEPESFTGGFLRSFALWKKWHLRHEDGART